MQASDSQAGQGQVHVGPDQGQVDIGLDQGQVDIGPAQGQVDIGQGQVDNGQAMDIGQEMDIRQELKSGSQALIKECQDELKKHKPYSDEWWKVQKKYTMDKVHKKINIENCDVNKFKYSVKYLKKPVHVSKNTVKSGYDYIYCDKCLSFFNRYFVLDVSENDPNSFIYRCCIYCTECLIPNTCKMAFKCKCKKVFDTEFKLRKHFNKYCKK